MLTYTNKLLHRDNEREKRGAEKVIVIIQVSVLRYIDY